MKQKVGFIGVGNMGYGMVKNLLAHDFSVIAFDIDQEKLSSVIELGAEKSENIEDLGDKVEVVILALPHPDISREVITSLAQSKTLKAIIETSTLTPEDSQAFKSVLDKAEKEYLCAPMLAGKQMAFEGRIHFVVEGDEEVLSKYREVFAAMGDKVSYMGDVPNATLAKLAYNICRYSNVATALEVIRFLKAYSSNINPMYNILVDGSLDNFGQVWKEDMQEVVEGKPYKFSTSKVPAKDLSLVINMAREKELSDGLFEEIKKVYETLQKEN